MRFDRPLAIGASGGHGPIRYVVEAYEPGRSITFRFTGPRGFDGTHAFYTHLDGGAVHLEHVLEMHARGRAIPGWTFVFRPLHDALIEDALDRAELAATGAIRSPAQWPLTVHLLRSVFKRRRRRP